VPRCSLLALAAFSIVAIMALEHRTDQQQAGLNLNLAGAVSGLFSSKSKKTTNPDGSSVEEREENDAAKGKEYIKPYLYHITMADT